DELAWNTIGRNGLVDAMTERSGIVQFRRQHANRCLQVGHEKRRSHALSHYIGNAQGKRTLVEANDVVVIAAHCARSLRGGGYRHSCRRAGIARHEPTLDLRGVLLFFLFAEPLLPEHAGTLNLLAKHAQQLRVVPGLLDKVARAAMHGLDRKLNRAPGGHDDYGPCAVNGQSLRHQLQAFTAGRGVTAVVQVEQRGVKVTVAECLQRVFRALYKLGFVAIALEQQMQRHDHVRLVFSHQNARPLRDAVKFKRRNGHNRIFSLAKHTIWFRLSFGSTLHYAANSGKVPGNILHFCVLIAEGGKPLKMLGLKRLCSLDSKWSCPLAETCCSKVNNVCDNRKLKKLLKGMRRGRSGMERQRWKLRGRLARRAASIGSIDAFKVVEKAERGSNKMMKGCDIGYALAASSCEGVNRVDACTVTASDVIAAFATSGPSFPLAEPAGFFGSERPLNCFIVRITQPTSDQLLFISTALSTVDAGDPKSEQLIVNTQHLCKRTNIWRGSAFDENRMNCGFGNLHQGCFPDIHSAFHKKRCSAGRTLPIRRQQNHLLTANSACLIVCLRGSFAGRFKQAYRVLRNNRVKSTAGSRMSGLIAYVDGG